MTDAEKILEMKNKIKEAEKEKDRLEGQEDLLMKRLKEEFKLKTLKQAEKKLTEFEKDLDSKELEFQKKLKELEVNYDWGY